MQSPGLIQKVHYTLRMAIAMCFIGHGAFGLITKPVWCNYFAVFGIDQDLSYRLMPAVGTADILLGLLMLFHPMRIIPAWLVIWGILTASLRPLSGEPFAEFIERAGNFGAPFAFLLLSGIAKNKKEWFERIKPAAVISERRLFDLTICLRIIVFLLLAGHGWLNLIEKKGLLDQYLSLGFPEPARVASITGIAEIAFACIALLKPVRPLLFIFFIWKMTSELFYPHYALFEWIERGGSYGAILALWFLTGKKSSWLFSVKRVTPGLLPDRSRQQRQLA